MNIPAACSSPTRPFTMRWPAVPPVAVGRSSCAKVVTVTPAVIAGAPATTAGSSGSPDNASATANRRRRHRLINAPLAAANGWQVAFAVAADLPRAVVASPVWVQIRHNPDNLSDRADR